MGVALKLVVICNFISLEIIITRRSSIGGGRWERERAGEEVERNGWKEGAGWKLASVDFEHFVSG
jgi:hypothetical protein